MWSINSARLFVLQMLMESNGTLKHAKILMVLGCFLHRLLQSTNFLVLDLLILAVKQLVSRALLRMKHVLLSLVLLAILLVSAGIS